WVAQPVASIGYDGAGAADPNELIGWASAAEALMPIGEPFKDAGAAEGPGYATTRRRPIPGDIAVVDQYGDDGLPESYGVVTSTKGNQLTLTIGNGMTADGARGVVTRVMDRSDGRLQGIIDPIKAKRLERPKPPPPPQPQTLAEKYPHVSGDTDVNEELMSKLEQVSQLLGGARVNIRDGRRTDAEQQWYIDHGYPKMHPAGPTAPHETGNAADVGLGDGDTNFAFYPGALEAAKQVGITLPIWDGGDSNLESWHVWNAH
ncbi:MAG: hypothetical protein H7287_14045, partial [Thermoleophilia bacterium]|nr:hypothetical protein [Thermoleophilia bacterium]